MGIATSAIVGPVDISTTPPIYPHPGICIGSGIFVAIIVAIISTNIILADIATNKLIPVNTQGCRLDVAGNVIVTPIYSNRRYESGVVIGYDHCSKKTLPALSIGIGLFATVISGMIGYTIAYNIGFNMLNPALAAKIHAVQSLNSYNGYNRY